MMCAGQQAVAPTFAARPCLVVRLEASRRGSCDKRPPRRCVRGRRQHSGFCAGASSRRHGLLGVEGGANVENPVAPHFIARHVSTETSAFGLPVESARWWA